MIETKQFEGHTPGPWRVKDGWKRNVQGQWEGRYFPSVVLVDGRDMGRGDLTVNVSHDQEEQSLMANANFNSSSTRPSQREPILTLRATKADRA